MSVTLSMPLVSKTNRGFSLIEFMIAMVLGLIIISGATSVYLASKNSLIESEQFASVSENGRFALQILNYAARHAAFFGSAAPADIRKDASLGAVSGDCDDPASAYNTSATFFAVRATSADVLGCIDDAMPNTDVLVLKNVRAQPLYDANPDDPNALRDGVISFPAGGWDAESVYVVANSEAGLIVDGADAKPDVYEGSELALGVAWPYRIQIFYIRNSVAGPVLSRKVLGWNGTAMAMESENLVQGVENMRFLFGFDSNNDGDVDSINSLAAVDAANAWDRVISMQAFILLRSQETDPGYINEKTYRLGDITLAPADDIRRLMMQTEITLRNPRLVLRGGA